MSFLSMLANLVHHDDQERPFTPPVNRSPRHTQQMGQIRVQPYQGGVGMNQHLLQGGYGARERAQGAVQGMQVTDNIGNLQGNYMEDPLEEINQNRYRLY